VTAPGTAQFLFLGRDPAVNPLGTFATELTAFGFLVTLNNNTFEVKRDLNRTSSGSTTIVRNVSDVEVTYSVTGSMEIAALYSFNGSPFMAAPPRMAPLEPAPQVIPEPASGFVAGAILIGLGIASRRRRIR
jgi:hypothetical protein